MSEDTQIAERLTEKYREFLSRALVEVVEQGFSAETSQQDIYFGKKLEDLGVNPHKVVDEAMEKYGGIEKFRSDIRNRVRERSRNAAA